MLPLPPLLLLLLVVLLLVLRRTLLQRADGLARHGLRHGLRERRVCWVQQRLRCPRAHGGEHLRLGGACV